MNSQTLVITGAIVIVLLGILFGIDRCSSQNQEFRVSCATAGGTLIETGQTMSCVANGSAVRR